MVPEKMPQNWAMNWRRGLAPSRYPDLRSLSRSALELAAPEVMPAVIRLEVAKVGLFDGSSTP